MIAAREWGPASRWSTRSFAVVWAGVVLSGASPFALGATFALLALWALQSRARLRFALLTVLCFAASPLAFALLVLVLAAIGLARTAGAGRARAPRRSPWEPRDGLARPLAALPGRRPLPVLDRGARRGLRVLLLGIVFTWRVQEARVLRWIYVLYLPVCVTAFLVPSSLGEKSRDSDSPPFRSRS